MHADLRGCDDEVPLKGSGASHKVECSSPLRDGRVLDIPIEPPEPLQRLVKDNQPYQLKMAPETVAATCWSNESALLSPPY